MQFASLRKELHSVHLRHAQVGNDDSERPRLRKLRQSHSAAGGGLDRESLAQLTFERRQDVRFIVYEKYFLTHRILSCCALSSRRRRAHLRRLSRGESGLVDASEFT